MMCSGPRRRRSGAGHGDYRSPGQLPDSGTEGKKAARHWGQYRFGSLHWTVPTVVVTARGSGRGPDCTAVPQTPQVGASAGTAWACPARAWVIMLRDTAWPIWTANSSRSENLVPQGMPWGPKTLWRKCFATP